MSTAVLSLGSNLADPMAQLGAAIRALGPVLRAASSVYRTPPWGPVEQDDFLNMVVIVSDAKGATDPATDSTADTATDPATDPATDSTADTATDAYGWWRLAQRLETQAHRERPVRWGPRTLDVDVIAVRAAGPGGADSVPVLSEDPDLLLPHPRAAERAFVLLPWAEIEPAAVLPGHGTIADLLAGLDTAGIERVGRCAE